MRVEDEDEMQGLNQSGAARHSDTQDQGGGRLLLVLLLVLFVASAGANIWVHLPSPQQTQPQGGQQPVISFKIPTKPTPSSQATPAQQPTPAAAVPNPRLSLGAPDPHPRTLRIAHFTKNPLIKNCTCLLTNGVNIISPTTVTTASNLLEQPSICKWVVLLDGYDPVADGLLAGLRVDGVELVAGQGNVSVDSGYGFIREPLGHCRNVIYLQHYFLVTEQQSATLARHANQAQPHQVFHSSRGLHPLPALLPPLGSLPRTAPLHHVFLIDCTYFHYITPLNFAYYTRYTVEQLFIWPVLAIVQGTQNLVQIEEQVHGYEGVVEQGKEWGLGQSGGGGVCFVSWPAGHEGSEAGADLGGYLGSVAEIEGVGNSAVVVYVQIGLKSGYMFQMYSALLRHPSLDLRLRVSPSRPALAAYQSAHLYCPNSSVMVTSRHHTRFLPLFLPLLHNALSAEHHFYFSNYNAQDGSVRELPDYRAYNRVSFRQATQYYEDYFTHMQIFKSDLLKMVYFWALKSDQVDFYSTEASFVYPMLQMVQLKVGFIKNVTYKLASSRTTTPLEHEQLQNLKKYLYYEPIPNNKLIPVHYNALNNVAYRRYARQQIPKLLHQVWLGKKEPTPFQRKLESTLKQVNKGYDYRLWTEQDLTLANFPIMYALIHRCLQYQQHSNRSYYAPITSLIRYQALYHHGGVYLDYKIEGRKPLDPFLKYQLFFIDIDLSAQHYLHAANVGNGIIGATQHNYQLHITITELISQESFDFREYDFPKFVGGYKLRAALTDQQLFEKVGFGFQLFSQKPGGPNLCCRQVQFREDQQQFKVMYNQKQYTIGIPCTVYNQAYLVLYKVLAGSWRVRPK